METFHSVSTAGHTNHRAPAATGKAQGKAGGMERTELRAHEFKVATVPKTYITNCKLWVLHWMSVVVVLSSCGSAIRSPLEREADGYY